MYNLNFDDMKTRQDYLEKKVTHDEYYSQFVTDYMVQTVSASIGIEKLKEAYKEDGHLNNIPLVVWDRLAFSCCQDNHTLRVKLKGSGDSYTMATGVCIMKMAARIAIKTN